MTFTLSPSPRGSLAVSQDSVPGQDDPSRGRNAFRAGLCVRPVAELASHGPFVLSGLMDMCPVEDHPDPHTQPALSPRPELPGGWGGFGHWLVSCQPCRRQETWAAGLRRPGSVSGRSW